MKSYPVYPTLKFEPKSGHNFKDCVSGEFSLIGDLIAKPTRIIVNGVPSLARSFVPRTIEVSNSIALHHSCLDHPGCTNCCAQKIVMLFLEGYTPVEVLEKLPVERTRIIDVCFEQEGRTKYVRYHCVSNETEINSCTFLIHGWGCTIHEWNPIRCMLPLIAFDHRKNGDKVIVRKRLPGRNWRIGCPIEFRMPRTLEEFEGRTISRFIKLKEYLDVIGVEHRVDWIIEQARQKAKAQLGGFL